MRAVILAGGKGTRLRPLTDHRPKPLVPFMAAPFAEGLLRRLRAAGCERATFLVGRDVEPFRPLGAVGAAVGLPVDVVAEERPLDTAGAARRLLAAAGAERVLVCNGDILTDLDFRGLLAAHEHARAVATLALTEVEDPSTFGVVTRDEQGLVRRFVEKPAPGTVEERTVNAGTYVLEPAAFDPVPGDGPLSFEREVFPALLTDGQRLLGVVSTCYWADLGTPERYLAGHLAVLEGRCRWPLPAALRVGPGGVAVHATARVDARARLGPAVVVDRGCVLGAGATVRRSVLLAGARVAAGAWVEGAIIGSGAEVREGAVVAPGTVLADGAIHPA